MLACSIAEFCITTYIGRTFRQAEKLFRQTSDFRNGSLPEGKRQKMA